LNWDGVQVRAAGATFPWPDVGDAADDSAERLVRRFFHACEGPRRRARTDRLLRRMARSALGGGTRRWKVMNALVSNRFSTMVGIDDRARRMQLISAHLLGLAYARYVFEVEPLASLPVEQIIALSVPVVQHYMADCPPIDRPTGDRPCPGDDCGWLSLDHRGRRRGCCMQSCGNRAQVAAFAQRRRNPG
jgi:hypothetical protein